MEKSIFVNEAFTYAINQYLSSKAKPEGIEYNSELRALYEKHCLSNELPKTDNTVINNLLQVLLAKNTLEEMNPKYLTKDLLREEWGFEGFVGSGYSSNFTGSGYMSPVLAVYNGNDTILTGMWSSSGCSA
jgi:hypothetical protein